MTKSQKQRAGADLSNAYSNFSDTQLGAEIFEFKDDPVPKFVSDVKIIGNYFFNWEYKLPSKLSE